MAKGTKGREVLLLRSGRTAWDDEGRLQGRTDLPLSESGRTAFIAGLRHALGAEGNGEATFTVVHHGPDEASKESAQIVSKQTGAKLKEVKGFRGMDVGLWDGLLESELRERHPRALKQWRNDPSLVTPPEGETVAALTERLLTSLVRVVEKPGDKPVVVILRQIGYGLLASALTGHASTDLWKMIQDGPVSTRVTVAPAHLKAMLKEVRAGV
jgi:broad specificity phosphatase PhoE